MRTCLDRLIEQPRMNGPAVRDESEYVSSRLEQCRHDGIISNDAFLDAGVIQGALEMIANHLDMGVDATEVKELLNQQLSRAKRLEEKHNGLDSAIELTR